MSCSRFPMAALRARSSEELAIRLDAIEAYHSDHKPADVEQYLELEASVKKSHAEMATTVEVAAIYSVGLGDMGHYVERFKALSQDERH